MADHRHSVFNPLLRALATYSSKEILVGKDQITYTYTDFEATIAFVQQKLKSKNIRKGDKVLVAIPMNFELYAVMEAIFMTGATAIFLDPWMKGKKMQQVIRQVRPKLFIAPPKIMALSFLLPAIWSLQKWTIKKLRQSDQKITIANVDDQDNALITFTSGTSGSPKGASRTFQFLQAQSQTLQSHLEGHDHVDFTNFPIAALVDFELGHKVIVPNVNLMKIHKADADKLIRQILDYKVTRLIVSPSLLSKILEKLPEKNSIETIITGGAPISIGLLQKSLSFPHIKFEAIYGSTEAEPICLTTFQAMLQAVDQPLNGVYVGDPVDEIELRVVTLETPHEINSIEDYQTGGNVGQIVVSGPHVNKHYYDNNEAFGKNKIVDGQGVIWHKTGDIGYRTDQGVYLVGRDHRIVERDGRFFYPYPIEQYVMCAFEIEDVGYVQNNDQILFYIHTRKSIDTRAVQQKIEAVDYPVDQVVLKQKPLPRDARHRSKLQIDKLS